MGKPIIQLGWLDRVGFAFDRALAILAPGIALARSQSRWRIAANRTLLSAYDAAARDRKTANMKRIRRGRADEVDVNEVGLIQDRSRDSVRNNPYAQSACASWARNVIGTGIVPTAFTPYKDFNKKLTADFWDWARRPHLCDAEGRSSFFAIQRIVMEEVFTVGQAFVLKIYDFNPRTMGMNLKLRLLENESLATELTQNPDNANEIRNGIEVDPENRIVAYWFYMSNSIISNRTSSPQRIVASRILHIFDKRQPGQTGGRPWAHASLRKGRDLLDFDNFTMLAAKIEASIPLIITRENAVESTGAPMLNVESDVAASQDSAGNRYANLDGGMLFEAEPGDKVETIKTERPGNGYEPFMKQNARAYAAGVNLSYETVSRDFTGGTYSSLRQSLLEDRRAYRSVKELIICEQFCQPVWEEFIHFGILEGVYKAPGYLEKPIPWQYAQWRGQGFEWINPKDEVDAYAKAIDYKISSRAAIAAEKGEDIFETFSQAALERDDATAKGLVLIEEMDRNKLHAEVLKSIISKDQSITVATGPIAVSGLASALGIPVNKDFKPTDAPATAGADGQPTEVDQLSVYANTVGTLVRAGAITPQAEDEPVVREKLNLPPMSDAAKAAWEEDGGIRRPITLQVEGAAPSPFAPAPEDPASTQGA